MRDRVSKFAMSFLSVVGLLAATSGAQGCGRASASSIRAASAAPGFDVAYAVSAQGVAVERVEDARLLSNSQAASFAAQDRAEAEFYQALSLTLRDGRTGEDLARAVLAAPCYRIETEFRADGVGTVCAGVVHLPRPVSGVGELTITAPTQVAPQSFELDLSRPAANAAHGASALRTTFDAAHHALRSALTRLGTLFRRDEQHALKRWLRRIVREHIDIVREHIDIVREHIDTVA